MSKVEHFRVFNATWEKVAVVIAVALLVPAGVLAATVDSDLAWIGYPSVLYLLTWGVNVFFDRGTTKAHNEHLRLMEQDFQEHLRRTYGVRG